MFPLFESFSGRLPDTEELLKQTDLTALKRCLLATQVKSFDSVCYPFMGNRWIYHKYSFMCLKADLHANFLSEHKHWRQEKNSEDIFEGIGIWFCL